MALGRGKSVFFFQDGKYGWSESLYNQSATDLQSLLQSSLTLAKLRARMLGLGPILTYIRVEDELVPRQTLAAEPNLQGGTDLEKSPGPSEVCWSTVLCRLQSGQQYHRPLLISGVPQEIVQDPPGPAQTTLWKQQFDAWVGKLESDGWCFKVIDKSAQNQLLQVASMTVTANFACQMVIPGVQIADYTKVRISNAKPKSFNGLFTLTNISGSPGTFLTVGTVFQSATYQGGAMARVQKYALAPITGALIRGETSRRRGRPFDSPRGRRKVHR